MAYDRDSFLAGIAVGRNMKSWPSIYEIDNAVFGFTVKLDRSWRLLQIMGIFWGKVFWGDGTSDECSEPIETYYNTLEHFYDGDGPYQVLVVGTIWNIVAPFGSGYTGHDMVISVDTPLPLYPLRNSAAWDYSGRIKFDGLRNLRTIPDRLFSNLLVPGMHITTLGAYFRDCKSLTDIPPDLFSGAAFSSVRSCQNMFNGCKGITQIPNGLLDSLSSVTDMSYAFYNMGLTSIPQDLFANCPNINDFQSTFSGNRAIRGLLPPLWEQYPDAFGIDCFSGCTNAANWSEVPASWGGPA